MALEVALLLRHFVTDWLIDLTKISHSHWLNLHVMQTQTSSRRSMHHCGKSRSMLRSTVDAITCVSSAGFSSCCPTSADVQLVDDWDSGDTAAAAGSGLSTDADELQALLPILTSRRILFSRIFWQRNCFCWSPAKHLLLLLLLLFYCLFVVGGVIIIITSAEGSRSCFRSVCLSGCPLHFSKSHK